jgi:hypothetical protein
MAAHPELADRIAALAPRLADHVAESMQDDPFWAARFGGDGQVVLREQALQHAERLARSLRVGDAAPVTERMRTVQSDAIQLGMTTRHLAQGSRRLLDAIHAAAVPDAGAARTMIDRAVLALRYADPLAAAVQDASRQLAEDAVVSLRGVHLGEEAAEAEWIDALEVMVSYLADAIAQRRPAILGDYVRWLGALGPPSLRPAEPAAMLGAVAGALDELPDAARREAAEYLAAARGIAASPA